MDRTIQYFQDMRNQKNPFSNISRIIDNVADSNFQSFQDGTESKKSVFQYVQDSGECCRPQFPIFPGWEYIILNRGPKIA